MSKLKNGTTIYLKPILCLLSDNVFSDITRNKYREYQSKNLVVCGTDTRYTDINIKDTWDAEWLLDDAIDFNKKK